MREALTKSRFMPQAVFSDVATIGTERNQMAASGGEFPGNLFRKRSALEGMTHDERYALSLRTFDRIENLFDRWPQWAPRNSVDHISDVVFSVMSCRLQIRPVVLPAQHLAEGYKLAHVFQGSKTKSGLHAYMQWTAEKWVAAEFSTKARREVRDVSRFGIVDVASTDAMVCVECGNSNIQNLIDTLNRDRWRYYLLPYQRSVERWFIYGRSSPVFMFEFIGKVVRP